MALCDSHSGSHWLSLALTATLWHTLALSGSLVLSNFACTALDWLTGPLLGSHRRCHDDALYPAFLPDIFIAGFAIYHSGPFWQIVVPDN